MLRFFGFNTGLLMILLLVSLVIGLTLCGCCGGRRC